MHVLALDTTTREGSLALVDDDRVVDERRGDAARPHAERLPREIVELLAAHQLAPPDVDVFAVAAGPGSFTGLRVGIATIQGLALATGRSIVPVSALEALAHAGSADLAPGALVAGWVDAHRQEVFAALYRVEAAPRDDPDRLTLLAGPTVAGPSATLQMWARWLDGAAATLIGDGAALHEATIRDCGAPGDDFVRVLAAPVLAGTIGRMAVVRARRGDAVHPSAVQPLYVRRPDVELARDVSR